VRDPEDMRRKNRQYAVTSTAKNIEVLAGAGDLANARKLAERLLAYDSTDQTKAVLQQALARAGQPELLAAPKP
jgi:hypothetical protein